jgi:hypothetical protein
VAAEVDTMHGPAVRFQPFDDRSTDAAGRSGDERDLHRR